MTVPHQDHPTQPEFFPDLVLQAGDVPDNDPEAARRRVDPAGSASHEHGPGRPAWDCSDPTCPYRERFVRAMALLRDLAHLVDAARSTPTSSSRRGA